MKNPSCTWGTYKSISTDTLHSRFLDEGEHLLCDSAEGKWFWANNSTQDAKAGKRHCIVQLLFLLSRLINSLIELIQLVQMVCY